MIYHGQVETNIEWQRNYSADN